MNLEILKKIIKEGEELLNTGYSNSSGSVADQQEYYEWFSQIILYIEDSVYRDSMIFNQIKEEGEYHYYKNAEKTLGILKGLLKYLEYNKDGY